MSKPIVLTAEKLSKTYQDGETDVHVLRDVNLEIQQGDKLAIVGSSGSGKSTLLHLLGGLDSPTEGEVRIHDQPLHRLNQRAASVLRNRHLGFVYQFHHLLPEFTALENVALPLVMGGYAPKAATEKAAEMLTQVGLGARLTHKPSALSGGERQRAALARAVVTEPDCLLADEPTGNLDSQTAQSVFDLLLKLNETMGTALVIVTHDLALAHQLDKQYKLVDGQLSAV
jgi:lipoprotein-releasing system ATP-binding protein